ncbi:hypothetical protein DV721_25830 [Klebsiella pneumoniae]|nr:hypothetical protein [Escherichia coli]EIW8494953.1 hypothetical protein [Klebsiella pneumoniae]HBX8146661.1 hypothetical protein [Klebsiella pneumoniae]
MVGYHQTNQKTDTGKTLTRWPVFVDHFTAEEALKRIGDYLRHILSVLPEWPSNKVAELLSWKADPTNK